MSLLLVETSSPLVATSLPLEEMSLPLVRTSVPLVETSLIPWCLNKHWNRGQYKNCL